MQAATHTAHDAARSDTRIRPPWVVWLIAGILLLSLARSILALASTGGVAPEARWLTFSVQLGVFVLLASGLWRRHPLVHRFYLVVPSLWLAFGALTLALAATRGQPVAGMLETCVSLATCGVLVFGLLRPAARAWFGLQCPRCSSHRIKPASLGMRRLACKACDHGWDRRAPYAVDPSTFD